MAPVLPLITDSDEHLDAVLGQVAEAGATSATVFALHLRPGAREWFLRWLASIDPISPSPTASSTGAAPTFSTPTPRT